MDIKNTLESNAKLLKSKVSRFAILGLVIAVFAISIATIAVVYQVNGTISLRGIIDAQSSNVALWILDLSPILFMFWGQSMGSIMSYTAGAMVMDQTHELRMQTNELASKAKHDASHDKLTGLPNRFFFTEKLVEAIDKLRAKNAKLAVVAININNFKDLNSGFGTYNADRLLIQFAQRLKSHVTSDCTVARFGADEFAILIPALDSKDDASELAYQLRKAVKINFALDDVYIDIAATTGVAFCPDHGQDAETLIQRSNLAIYTAKQMGNEHAVYDQTMDMGSPNKLILMSELKKAIEADQILIFFQPKIDLQTGMIKGCEALIRWKHPTFGMMNADKFIPIAEKTGLIKPLSLCVMRKVIEYASHWHKNNLNIEVSLNLSAIDIIDVDLPPVLEKLLQEFALPPEKLKLELIESAHLSDHTSAIAVINRLAEIGVKISIDDFGTGYSSFIYLTLLPISEIKIDKSFVMGMHENPKNQSIIEAMIKLAATLNLVVVAEGVEKAIHVKLLSELGCDLAQGYFFSEAVPAEAFENMVFRGIPMFDKKKSKLAKATANKSSDEEQPTQH